MKGAIIFYLLNNHIRVNLKVNKKTESYSSTLKRSDLKICVFSPCKGTFVSNLNCDLSNSQDNVNNNVHIMLRLYVPGITQSVVKKKKHQQTMKSFL